MNCHECARDEAEQTAVAICRYCSVALCQSHLVASFRTGIYPQRRCEHHPERAFAPAVVAKPAVQPTISRAA